MSASARLRLLVAAIAAAGTLVAGCSSSDTSTPATSTAPGTPATPSSTPSSTSSSSTTGPDRTARPVTTRHQVTVGGTTRTYLLTVPDPLPAGELALVVGFHGGFGSGDQFRTTSHLDDQAAARGFIAAFPDGTVDEAGGAVVAAARSWNAGRCCGPARYLEVDDVAFFDALVADVASQQDIDPRDVLVTGHSNGAMMAFRLACDRSTTVAAVAPVAGSVEAEPCSPDRPASVLAIHGDADQNHPIEGGRGARGVSGVDYRPLRAGMDTLAAAAGCDATPRETVRGPETVLTWSGCADGRAVEARIVAGADHPWPGSEPRPSTNGLQGQPSQAIDATAEVVDFLLAHRG